MSESKRRVVAKRFCLRNTVFAPRILVLRISVLDVQGKRKVFCFVAERARHGFGYRKSYGQVQLVGNLDDIIAFSRSLNGQIFAVPYAVNADNAVCGNREYDVFLVSVMVGRRRNLGEIILARCKSVVDLRYYAVNR